MKTKTYVITGAASGIGKALLEKIAENNIVFAGYRNKKHEIDLKTISPNIYPFYIDYSKPETIKRVEPVKAKDIEESKKAKFVDDEKIEIVEL